jgi:hypothetical protein
MHLEILVHLEKDGYPGMTVQMRWNRELNVDPWFALGIEQWQFG